MRKYFRSLADVLASPIVAAVNALRREVLAGLDQAGQSSPPRPGITVHQTGGHDLSGPPQRR